MLIEAFNEAKYKALMEKLEAVEVKLKTCQSIIDFRIDANTYKKDYIKSDLLLSSLPNNTIDEISISIQNFGAYSLCNFINFIDSGIPFLMTQNVRHNYIDWNIEKFVDKISHEMLQKSHCTNGQVLVTMAGEYLGRVAVYDKNEICSSNQAIAKISLKNHQNPYFVSTFLNSTHGQNQINRFKTITGQPNINMALIKSLRIPDFSFEFQSEIEQIVKESELKRNFTSLKYLQAENLLLESLNLQNFKPNTNPINVKSFRDSFLSSGRLDAEYYQKKYEDYQKLIEKFPYGFGLLSSVCNLKDKNYNPDNKKEYKYIELANIGKSGEIEASTTALGKELPSRARRKVSTNDVIISSIEGSLNSCALVTEKYNNALCSTGFYVINSKSINSETLLVLFKSQPLQELLKQNCSGTILTAINKTEFLNIPIPLIDNEIQKSIKENITESFQLKKQSEELLEAAKKAVEIAIEQNEEEAIKHLEGLESNKGINP
jgi:restriction endonuclease S subunit